MLLADAADSDFGDGGTNRKGHIYWLAYAPTNNTTAVLKYIQSDVISRQLSPSVAGNGERINRYQADFNVRF